MADGPVNRLPLLWSFAFASRLPKGLLRESSPYVAWMMDSGAHSMRRGVFAAGIEDYIAFVRENLPYLWRWVMLDIPNDTAATLKNWRIFRDEGMSPMLVVTVDGNIDEAYTESIAEAEDICVAGGVTLRDQDYHPRVTRVRSLCGDKWLHALGYSRGLMASAYPLNSLDSSSHSYGFRSPVLALYNPIFGLTWIDRTKVISGQIALPNRMAILADREEVQ